MDLVTLKSVSGFSLSAWRSARPQEYRDGVVELTRSLLSGVLRATVYARLPLSQAEHGHRLIEDRVHHGRVVLIPELDRN
jgi:NADPH2:quinone reductase